MFFVIEVTEDGRWRLSSPARMRIVDALTIAGGLNKQYVNRQFMVVGSTKTLRRAAFALLNATEGLEWWQP